MLSFYHFFQNKYNNLVKQSINVRIYLSYNIKITLKMHFWCDNVQDLSLYRKCCYGCHKITVLNFNR